MNIPQGEFVAVFVTLGLLAVAIRQTWNWIYEIRFYRNLDWDFSEGSGKKLRVNVRGARGASLSNKDRVVWGYPTAIFVCLIMILLVVLNSLVGGALWQMVFK
jgi:hypothetical protein